MLRLAAFLIAISLCASFPVNAGCTKVLEDGDNGIALNDPYGFIINLPQLHSVTVKTNGHEIEYIFTGFYTSDVVVMVDGKFAGQLDPSTAISNIHFDCGPQFLQGFSSDRASLRAGPRVVTSPGGLAGQSNLGTAVADFDRDGVPDSAVITGNGIIVTLFNASGGTKYTMSYQISGVSASIVAADFNRDGIPDLAITQNDNSGHGGVAVLRGNGDGTFGSPAIVSLGSTFSFYLVTGDFNGDGATDIAVSTIPSTVGSVSILLNIGDGTFSTPVNYSAGVSPATIVAADFNGDGILDIATLDSNTNIANKVWVLPGRRDGTFGTAMPTATGTGSAYLSYADLDHDGKPDLVIADQTASAMVVMRGNGDGTFRAPENYVSGAQPISVAPLALGDGSTSLTTLDNVSGELYLAFADPNGTVHLPHLQTIGTNLASVAAADLNGDHRPDLVISDTGSGNIFVKLSTAPAGFGQAASYPTGSKPGTVIIADVNRDGKPDIVAADASGIDVLVNNGNGTFAASKTIPVAGGVSAIAIADFNDDGNPDIAAVGAASQSIYILTGNSSGGFQNTQTLSLGNGPVPLNVAVGDFNSDGKPDLAVAFSPASATQAGGVALFSGNGDGSFHAGTVATLPGAIVQQSMGAILTTGVAVGDFNSDGNLDVAVAISSSSNFTHQLAVLPGDGKGSWGAPVLSPILGAPPAMTVTDFNADGKLDLVLGDCCGLAEAGILFGNGDGSFQPEFNFPSGPNPYGVAVADYNSDGTPDIAVVGHLQPATRGTLAVWYNTGNFSVGTGPTATVFSSAPAISAAIAPNSLASAYGADLAVGTPGGTPYPLPTTFGGTSLTITDSTGKAWPAPLVYVSSGQVNFLVPPGVASGAAQLAIVSGDGTVTTGSAQIAQVAPGLYVLNTANLAAAIAIRYSTGGTQTVEPVYSLNAVQAIVASPIDLGAATDQVYLEIYGTGIQAAGTGGVTVTANGAPLMVQYAGSQGAYEGLDQVNVLLPRSLTGAGIVTLQITAAGIAANAVQIIVK